MFVEVCWAVGIMLGVLCGEGKRSVVVAASLLQRPCPCKACVDAGMAVSLAEGTLAGGGAAVSMGKESYLILAAVSVACRG